MKTGKTVTGSNGSTATYVIVGIILVGLVLGGIYLIQKRQVSPPGQKPIATKKTTESPTKPSSTQQDRSPTSSKNDGTASSNPYAQPNSGVIPQTGPYESVQSPLMMAVLSAFLIAYLRSKQAQETKF